MPLVIKSDEEEKTPHLAMTHNELQGGAANKRNVSLLMKSDAEMTEEVVKALTELGISDDSLSTANTAGVDSETLEASGDVAVNVEKSQEEVIILQEEITKAVEAAELVLKAKLEEKEVELQKALEQITAFQAEKKEVIAKARAAAISEVEKDEKAAEALLKSLEAVSDESFEVVIKSLKAKEEKLEDSDLFVKKSKNTEVEEPESENATSAILKAKYAKQ